MMQALNMREKCGLIGDFSNHEALVQSVFRSSAERVLLQRFRSSDKLTGSQTFRQRTTTLFAFRSSDKLTGSQTNGICNKLVSLFRSSDKLTGSQTEWRMVVSILMFRSSDKLTGSQPQACSTRA